MTAETPAAGDQVSPAVAADKGISAQRLLAFIQRIERIREGKAALAADEREVFAEAKSTGFDTKQMKKVLKVRAMDPAEAQEQAALFEIYAEACGGKTNGGPTP